MTISEAGAEIHFSDWGKWQRIGFGLAPGSAPGSDGDVAQRNRQRAKVREVTRRYLVDLIARVATGETGAFASLYASTSSKLYGIVVRIVRRHDLAEDVLQEVYLRVWRRAGEFDAARSSPITWLSTIARNRALDEARRKMWPSIEELPHVFQVAGADNPAGNCERADEGWRLQSCIDRLEPRKRKTCCSLTITASPARRSPARSVAPSPR